MEGIRLTVMAVVIFIDLLILSTAIFALLR